MVNVNGKLVSSNVSPGHTVVKMAAEYGKNSSTHKKTREVMMGIIRTNLQKYLEDSKPDCLLVGDIGCADGRNSIDLYQVLNCEDPKNPDELSKLLMGLQNGFKFCLSDLNDQTKEVARLGECFIRKYHD